jgi:NnrS protein
VIVLISVVGGRVIPSFTRNWLAKRPHARLPVTTKAVERAALGNLHTGMIGWAFVPDFRPVGVLLLLGAATNLWRMSHWRGTATRTNPLLLILHIGYTWLVLGAGLLGLSVLAKLAQSAAIHALTAGAIGTMTLAVMTRVTLGHTGRELTADRSTIAIFLLVTVAAAARVVAAASGTWVMPLPRNVGSFVDRRVRPIRTSLWSATVSTAVRGFRRSVIRRRQLCSHPNRRGARYQPVPHPGNAGSYPLRGSVAKSECPLPPGSTVRWRGD